MKALILLSLLGLALAGCTSEPSTPGTDTPVIELHSVTFEPGDITVSVGDTVTFRVVQASHTIDFSEGTGDVAGVSKAHSGNLDVGDVYTVTFTEAGTYPYFCSYHSSLVDGKRVGMIGTITVIT